MKLFKYILTLSVVVLCTACDIAEVGTITDPNNPSAEAVLENATRGDIQNLIYGLESAHRYYNNSDSDLWSLVGSFGRELFYYNASDPNYAAAWLQFNGAQNAEESNAFFVDASSYESPYAAVRQANLVIASVQNSEAYNEQEKNAAVGFANTIKAFQLLIPLNVQYTNGIRVDLPVDDTFSPGPFLSYEDALDEIRSILDEGANQLMNAGNDLPFALTNGFSGFNSVEGMYQVNRAIAARAAIYAEDWDNALSAIDNSFIDEIANAAALNNGPKHTFAGGNDQLNHYFYADDSDPSRLVVPHPSMLADAQVGDLRVTNKFNPRTTPATSPDIPGSSVSFQHGIFQTPTDPIPFIRNEELILIKAEALAQRNSGSDLADAVALINIIRNTWGLPDFASVNQSDIIDQILFERRYSLWAEGHRWIDARRYNIIDELDTSIEGGRVPLYIGRPSAENDWDDFSGN